MESLNTKNLIIFTGIPSSGKTTIANLLGKRLELEYNKKTMVVGSDQIRTMVPSLAEKFIPEREESIRKLTIYFIEKALDFNDIVINDDMNYYKSMRHDFYGIAIKKGCNFFLIEFKIDLKIALKWNKARGSPIPQNLIRDIRNKSDELGTYKWDIPLITIDNTNNNPKKNVELIIQVLLNKLDQRQFDNDTIKIKNEPGKAEFYDKLTRKIVSEVIKKPKFISYHNEILVLRKLILKSAIENDLKEIEIKELLYKKLNDLI